MGRRKPNLFLGMRRSAFLVSVIFSRAYFRADLPAMRVAKVGSLHTILTIISNWKRSVSYWLVMETLSRG